MKIEDYELLYNAAAHFKALDRYPDGLVSAMSREGYAGFEAVCWALAQLNLQAELARRDMGHESVEPLRMATALVQIKPTEIMQAKIAIMQALSKGLAVEEDANTEIDEVLAEEEKKTESDLA